MYLINMLKSFFFLSSAISAANNDKSIELCNNSAFVPQISYPYARRVHEFSLNHASNIVPVNSIQVSAKPMFQLKHLLYLGNAINGLSSASMTSLAFSYIEDIAPHRLSAIYESVYYAVGALGMGVGFITTSNFLSFHTDFNRPNNELPDWLLPNHPNWIGAW